MRNEEIIIDLADPVFTKTIRSRQNDKNGLSLTVNLKEYGKVVVLTGYKVMYEATRHTGELIRDEARIVDAANGVFEYKLSPESVSMAGDWTAYFVLEKNDTERMSTPDIRISLKRDARERNIKIENYISDFEKAIERVKGYRKELDEANKKIGELKPYIEEQYLKTNKKIEEVGASIAANSVVKKSGDTMTGPLLLEHKGADSPLQVSNSSGRFRFLPQKDMNAVESATVDGKAKNLCVTGQNNSMLDKVQVKTKELTVDGVIKQGSDIGWTNLPVTGVESIPDRSLKYKRSGDQITVIGSIKNVSNVTVFATLPAGCKPVQNIAFPALAYGNVPTICEVTVKSDGGIFVNGVQSGNTVHIAMSYSV
ncbi:BppU family phage baseplate upper protein [Bacillus mycoides]|uniref:BppU family phage baseplate upper protein n=1 Tax=Bacillus mycoides TaxID=1405 RepID=UPI0021136313|nr:BppU family phage baseplate upper protein [Bacillus mycoides]MCQ6531151.1 BppU family phage baseplate upper protein [Bacillus mycoides]